MPASKSSSALSACPPSITGAPAAPSAGTESHPRRQRCLGRSHHLRARGGDREDVLQSNPELAVLVDPGLVAESHSRLEHDLAAAHQVRPLVSFQSDAVTEPVGEGSIIWSVTG